VKKIALLFVGLFSMAWIVAACTNTGSTSSGGTGTSGSATATPAVTIAATVGVAAGPSFSPNSMTITHGQAVVWNATLNGGGHTVNIDTTAGTSGTCGTADYSSFPVTYVFPTAGTYYFHCDNHSGCGAGSCGVCSGGLNMIGSVVVN
jgi:plastocyanin